jgi:hypothetical protein
MRRRPTDQEIAARAHVLWEQSGEPKGDPQDKWLQAKAELEAAEAAAESSDIASGHEEPQATGGPPERGTKPRSQ